MTFVPVFLCLLGAIFPVQIVGFNAAVGGKAYQTSDWKPWTTADKAVDGDDSKQFYSQTCTHTACDDHNPYWTVCLGDTYDITQITIANPDKSCGRLKNILVEVFDTDPSEPGASGQTCATIGSTPAPDNTDVILDCQNTLTGKYVKISKHVTNWGWNLSWCKRCDALLLCEVTVKATITCGKKFVKIGDSCYFFSYSDNLNWFQAREACEILGADLAIIDSKEETEAVLDYMQNELKLKQRHKAHWIGLQGLRCGDIAKKEDFEWVDPLAPGSDSYSYWEKGKPAGSDTECVFIEKKEDNEWHDGKCFAKKAGYVCENSLTFPKEKKECK